MRATKGKHEIRKRFAIVIGVAAVGVMALGAQTGAAVADVGSYDTRVTINHEGVLGDGLGARFGGEVKSEVEKCRERREVILFRKRPGPDRKLGATRSTFRLDLRPAGRWGLRAAERGRVYAKATRKVGDGFECLADYSRTITCWNACAPMWRSLQTGAQTQAPTPRGQAPPTCKGKPATIVITEGNEGPSGFQARKGTAGRDVIVGLGGNERIGGRGGDDLICGRDGFDVISGGRGKDTLLGQAGGDFLDGGYGNDTLLGQAGGDELMGGPGKDRCLGGKGRDITATIDRTPPDELACEVEKSIERSGVQVH